jgi:protein-S-isoprenylcysteine O-methyltransferase Ste14
MIKHHTHTSMGEQLTGEHAIGDAGQTLLAILFMTIWILDTFFLELTTSLNRFIPLAVRIPLGSLLLIPSAYLAGTGLFIVFGKKRDTSGVIRDHVFSVVRHPIYLSEILLYFGLLVLSISLAAVCIWFAAIVFLHFIARYEEKLLMRRFGEEYKEYMKDVPMWIPRLRKYPREK